MVKLIYLEMLRLHAMGTTISSTL